MWKLSTSVLPVAGAASDPPVPAGARAVDAAEAQRLLADVELVEAGEAGADDDVALFAELVGPPRPWSSTEAQ